MMQDPTIFAWDMLNEPRCDCFPITIPPPEDDVSCRPDCALKMQVSASMTARDVAKSDVTNHPAGRHSLVHQWQTMLDACLATLSWRPCVRAAAQQRTMQQQGP